MAERWQQWMPFHIDRWRGSPSVQGMHPAAQMGYLNLLCSCWQSTDCCVPSDPIDLATESRLGDELWALYGPRILRKFILTEERWRNQVLFKEWEEARKVYEKRKSGALRTNESRSANGERTQSSRNTDTQTLTGTLTEDIGLTPLLSATPKEVKIRPEEFANAWNRLRGSLPKVESFTDGRRKKVITRVDEGLTLDRFAEAVENCRIKPHLKGDNGWTADFDWLIKNSTNIEKAINNPYGLNGEIKNGKIDRAYNAAAKLIQEVEDHHVAHAGELLPWSGAE